MLIDPKRIKPNDGSFKGGYTVRKTSARSNTPKVVVTPITGDPNFDYMCLDGHHRVEGAVRSGMGQIDCDVADAVKASDLPKEGVEAPNE